MTVQRKSLRIVLLFCLAFFVFSYLFTWMVQVNPNITLANAAFYGALILFWIQSIENRVMQRRLRRDLLLIGFCMLLWMVLRECRYEYVPKPEWDTLSRHLWYAYYIPFLLMAVLSFRTSLLVGKPEGTRYPRSGLVAGFGTLLLLGAVMTNDLHQLMFVFSPGFENWEKGYGHGPLFYVIYALILLLLAGSIVNLIRATLFSPSRKWAWMLLLPLLVGIVYWKVYPAWAKGVMWLKFPEMTCFLIGLGWETAIQTGLVPSNTGYLELFGQAHLHAVLREEGSEPLAEETAPGRIRHHHPIPGGEVVWEEDVSAVRKLEAELEVVNARMKENVDLLRAENELKEEQANTKRKNEILDQISRRFEGQSRRIAELIEEAEQHPELRRDHLVKACALAVYIKRCAAMMLSSAEKEEADIRNLFLCLKEEDQMLQMLGIRCTREGSAEGMVLVSSMLEAYTGLEEALEAHLDGLASVLIRVRETDTQIGLRAVFESDCQTPEQEYTFSLQKVLR